MSLTSLKFFLFLGITLLLFYSVKKYQKYILLLGSVIFYLSAPGIDVPMICLLMIYIIALTHYGAVFIEKAKTERTANIITFISIAGLSVNLFILKYAFNLGELVSQLFHLNPNLSWLQFVPVIGLSYFSLSAIGYLIDIRWKLYEAEKDITTTALFIFYFPQVISGPVTRFAEIRYQLVTTKTLEVSNIEYGIRRMLWGFFKKLVISERFALIVSATYGNPQYGGGDLFIATLCYAIQLYTDFSGCMDIVLGASTMFGVKLPENFKSPFFSKTIQEFWQRWHITLGLWFKDYVMYPIQKSDPMVKIGKTCKLKFGKKVGKKVPFYLSMLVLWILIGMWHGCTAYYFVAAAVIPCTLIMMSDLLGPISKKVSPLLPLKNSDLLWINLKRLRTFLLICICWVFVCAGTVSGGMESLFNIISDFSNINTVDVFVSTGKGKGTVILMVLGLALLFFADYLKEKGSSIYEFVSSKPFLIRSGIIYAEIFAILYAGMVGQSQFIYFQF